MTVAICSIILGASLGAIVATWLPIPKPVPSFEFTQETTESLPNGDWIAVYYYRARR